ncbi:MAG: response regulator [Duncaniella sp.]|nr:response regulator [Duncaniella sp.]
MRLLLLIPTLFIVFQVRAAELFLKHLDTGSGLSNNKINAIHRDSEGFLWIGTSSGLCRYDGYRFRIYHPMPEGDDKSLNGSYIEDIQEDADGNLWVNAEGGYYIYSPDTDSVTDLVPEILDRWGVSTMPDKILIDHDKNIWIYVEGTGIYNMRRNTEKATLLPDADFGKSQLANFLDTPEGILTIDRTGVMRLVDKTSLKTIRKISDISAQLPPHQSFIFTIMYDNNGLAWIYSNEQLWLYDFRNDRWLNDHLPSDGKNLLIKVLLQNHNGDILIGRDHHGLELVEKSGDKIKFTPVADNAEKNVNNTVTVLYEDPANTLWIGTYKKGLFYYNESAQKFKLLPFPDVNCLTVGKNGTVWVGTDAAGLISLNPQTNQTVSYRDPSVNGSEPAITSLLETPNGDVYIGNFSRGLKRLRGGKFEHLVTSTSLDSIYSWALAPADNGNIWIGTLGAGVYYFNPTTNRIRQFTVDNSGLSSDYIVSITKGKNGLIYFATAVGVCIYNPGTQKISKLEDAPNNNINEVVCDSRGLIWIAWRGGLDVYDPLRGKMHTVQLHADNSPSFVLGIQEDTNGNMWIADGAELAHLTTYYDDKTGDFRVDVQRYDHNDGLQNSDFNQRSFAILPDGEILIGGLYGINRFTPNNIKLNRTLPTVMFSSLRMGGEEIHPGEKVNGKVVLSGALNRTRKIELWHGNSNFTITVATDNYVLPEKTTYYYMLEGFNTEWVTANRNTITYTNLSPGKYRLLVTAMNSDGYKSIHPAVLEIIVHPPFWATTWAKLLYIFLLAGLVYLTYRLIRMREQRKFNEKRKEDAMMKQEELNQLKFKFFTNVSHDLRTPLTLIVSPLESMISETTDPSRLKRLTMMRNNAQRLLHMVNQLLDFRKNEVTGLTLNPSEGDLVSFIRNVCQSFTMLSERNNVALNFFSPLTSLHVNFDEDKMSKIMMNLLGNAFKYTPEGGKVDVTVETSGTDIVIKVADTGTGIKDADKEHIFERFYQGSERSASASVGNGIGLSLVSEYVNLHNGNIRAVDNVDRGTVFIITIPNQEILSPSSSDVPETGTFSEPTTQTPTTAGPSPQKSENQPEKDRKTPPLALVVDDSPDMLEFLKDGLEKEFHVITAPNGKAALKILDSVKPAIIVTDLMMPEMDGIELCRQLKSTSDFASIPVVILTAKHDARDKVEGLTIGADDYMTKPFDIRVLILRMKKLISLTRRGAGRTLIDPEPGNINITPLDEKLVEKAVKFVVANIKRSDLSVEELSSHLGMSRVHLYKKLKSITGKTPIEFIRIIRLKRGAQMLRESQLNVSEVAYQLGFNSPKYFSKYFKEEFGILPSAYQEKEEQTTNHPL